MVLENVEREFYELLESELLSKACDRAPNYGLGVGAVEVIDLRVGDVRRDW